MGVKDASALIPGHGGFWDRFDALLGASLFMILMADVFGLRGIHP
jgi:phosphatidate cytidylyltransferase